MRVEWSLPAVSDLKTISEYIEHDRSLDTANRVARSIYDTREMVIPRLPYIVIYTVFEDRITIVNVVHGAQKRP